MHFPKYNVKKDQAYNYYIQETKLNYSIWWTKF